MVYSFRILGPLGLIELWKHNERSCGSVGGINQASGRKLTSCQDFLACQVTSWIPPLTHTGSCCSEDDDEEGDRQKFEGWLSGQTCDLRGEIGFGSCLLALVEGGDKLGKLPPPPHLPMPFPFHLLQSMKWNLFITQLIITLYLFHPDQVSHFYDIMSQS